MAHSQPVVLADNPVNLAVNGQWFSTCQDQSAELMYVGPNSELREYRCPDIVGNRAVTLIMDPETKEISQITIAAGGQIKGNECHITGNIPCLIASISHGAFVLDIYPQGTMRIYPASARSWHLPLPNGTSIPGLEVTEAKVTITTLDLAGFWNSLIVPQGSGAGDSDGVALRTADGIFLIDSDYIAIRYPARG